MPKLLTCPQCGAKRGIKTMPYHTTVCRGGSSRAGKPPLVTRDDTRTPQEGP